jgi:hypothetical protein
VTKKIVKLKLSELDRSGLCQSRVTTDPERLAEYQLAWQTEGTEFPPCIVYQDGDKYYIADGFHRIQSKMLARLETRQEQRTIECEVRQGTMQDAITYSLGANLRHGLRPNTADKKRAILLYYGLKPEHCAHSNNEVSKVCGCSHTFVGAWRATCISSPIDITYAEVKIPILILKQTIEHLKAAQAEGKIVTTRNGKLLEQKISPKAPEEAPKSLPKEHLMLPTEAEMSGLQISSKALPEPNLYIVTTTASIIPRGTVIEGWESLTDTGNITTDWETSTVLIANEDLIEIPYPIDSTVTPIEAEKELTVQGYALVASDLRIISIDKHGFAMNHSSEMLEPYIKKDDVEKSTPPILDLSILTTKQLEEIIATIGHEIYRRASLPQDIPDLAVC